MRKCKLGSGGGVTLEGGTTFLHINTLAHLPGTTRDTQSMCKPCFASKPVDNNGTIKLESTDINTKTIFLQSAMLDFIY